MSFIGYQLYDLHKLSLQGSVLVCFNTGLARITWKDTFMWQLLNITSQFCFYTTQEQLILWGLERYLLLGKHSAKWSGLYHALYISQGRIWDCPPFLMDVDFFLFFILLSTYDKLLLALLQMHALCDPSRQENSRLDFQQWKMGSLEARKRDLGVVQQKIFHP